MLPIPSIAVGRSAVVDVDGTQILLCRTAAGLHATRGTCPHQNKSLEGARVRGVLVMCPWHGAMFDLDTGTSRSPQLTDRPLRIYRCVEQDGEVMIDLD
ncbi:Rieske 2Fe-2S domain-containing protein [Sphingomonas aliaeris]|uniref:Rieske 2Fe-2S domain-containing protein n=1 Tax=Sphingomonas aliaeris TaxID=2759526 RepID=A0A974NVJ5_9SPHN|nr:Rieske 2Fe-2S domain-containing protein [Sphingomonas aliaeris]QQV77660.1 Rieske 2Fe-2S domain-containing protein [Sphingomonas aliaeris]